MACFGLSERMNRNLKQLCGKNVKPAENRTPRIVFSKTEDDAKKGVSDQVGVNIQLARNRLSADKDMLNSGRVHANNIGNHSYTPESRVKSGLVSVHQVFQEFADGTSMHGVPRIINARSLHARFFWSFICIGAFGMFFWQSYILLQRYWSYPKKVTMEMVQRPIKFPAVSVCNTDHLDLLMVDHIESLLMEANTSVVSKDPIWKEFEMNYEAFRFESVNFFQHYIPLFPWAKAELDMLDVYSRLGLTANMGKELASTVGIKLDDFIINCRFMDKNCNTTESFEQFFDPYFFNCFTFLPQTILQNKATRLQGVEYGLTLMLFTGSAGHLTKTDDYSYIIPGMEESNTALASGRGARVVVHDADILPYPTMEGYDIPPGFSVTIGVKARENVRIGPPHGNCTEQGNTTDRYKYTLTACQNNCIKRKIMQTCGCIDNRISLVREEDIPFCFELPNLPPECNTGMEMRMEAYPAHCNDMLYQWADMMACRKEVYENMTIKDSAGMDHCQCFPSCNDILYESLYSLSTLPEQTEEHTAFYSGVKGFLDYRLSEEKKKLLNKTYGTKYTENLSTHLSRLIVHIADSNVIKTTESPDYEAIRLVSDIGGQLGLWIGISVMTLFEVMQLVADVFRFVTFQGRNLGERRHERLERVPTDNRVDRDRDLDHCEIDKLTAV